MNPYCISLCYCVEKKGKINKNRYINEKCFSLDWCLDLSGKIDSQRLKAISIISDEALSKNNPFDFKLLIK